MWFVSLRRRAVHGRNSPAVCVGSGGASMNRAEIDGRKIEDGRLRIYKKRISLYEICPAAKASGGLQELFPVECKNGVW